jgi:hypothetical protein
MKAAISRSEQAARPPEPQPSPELRSILVSSGSSAPVSPQESEALLKQFMQWQQKPADAQDKQ